MGGTRGYLWKSIAALAAIAFSLAMAGPASAATTAESDQAAVVGKMYAAGNSTAAYQALSDSEKTMFSDSLKHLTAKSYTSGTGTLGTNKSDLHPLNTKPGAVTTMDAGCWYVYLYQDWYDIGYYEGSTWMQLNWCSDGYNITSYYADNIGGAGANGFSYNGSNGPYFLDVGWEVRAAAQYNFTVGPVPANPCMQIRGGATGLYSTPYDTCNLG